MKHKNISLLILLLVVTITTSTSLFSQEGTGRGRIKGEVKDEAGNPIEGVKIVATYPNGTTFEATTDRKGKWAIAGMGTGVFRIVATKDGYQSVHFDQNVSQFKNDPVDFTMKKIIPLAEGVPRIEDKESLSILEEGNQLFTQKQYSEALAKYEEFLEKNPTVQQVKANIANCYREMGKYDEALTAYRNLQDEIKQDKGSLAGDKMAASLLANIGDVYVRKGELDQASQYFQQSIEIDPADEVLAFNVAEIYFKQGDSDKAISYYKLAIKIKETWPRPYKQLGYAYLNKGEYKLAIDAFKKFLELDPDNPQAPTVRNLIPSIEKLIKELFIFSTSEASDLIQLIVPSVMLDCRFCGRQVNISDLCCY